MNAAGDSCRDLVTEVLETGEVSPRAICDKVGPRLTDEHREYLVQEGLWELVTTALRNSRRPGTGPPASRNGKRAMGAATRHPKAWPYSVDGTEQGWKPLAECTVEDLRQIADLYAVRARQNAAAASRINLLADELVKANCRVVDDLSDELVERLMTA